VIEDAPGRADHDFGAAAQRANLVIHRRAAIDRHDVQVRALGVLVQRFGDLHRQLARRHPAPASHLAAVVLLSCESLSRSGSAKAAVLPVPVAAWRHVASRRAGRGWLRVELEWVLRNRRSDGRDDRAGQPSDAKAGSIARSWSLHLTILSREPLSRYFRSTTTRPSFITHCHSVDDGEDARGWIALYSD
jgi:hypothetical protein